MENIIDRDILEKEKKQVIEGIKQLQTNILISEAVLRRLDEEIAKFPIQENGTNTKPTGVG